MVNNSNVYLLRGNFPMMLLTKFVNSTIKALLSNFRDNNPPDSRNYSIGSIPTGTLFNQQSNGVLVVNDSNYNRPGGFTGTWTRNGIGVRVANSSSLLTNIVQKAEEGELISYVTSSNNRVLLMTDVNRYVDVGLSGFSSIDSTMVLNRTISNTKIVQGTLTQYEFASRTLSNVKLKANNLTRTEFANRSIANTNIKAKTITQYEINYIHGNNIQPYTLDISDKLIRDLNSSIVVANSTGFFNEFPVGPIGSTLTMASNGIPYWDASTGLSAKIFTYSSNAATKLEYGNILNAATWTNYTFPSRSQVFASTGIEVFNVSIIPTSASSNIEINYKIFYSMRGGFYQWEYIPEYSGNDGGGGDEGPGGPEYYVIHKEVVTDYDHPESWFTCGALFIIPENSPNSISNLTAIAIHPSDQLQVTQGYSLDCVEGTYFFKTNTTSPIRILIKLNPSLNTNSDDTFPAPEAKLFHRINFGYTAMTGGTIMNDSISNTAIPSTLQVTEYS